MSTLVSKLLILLIECYRHCVSPLKPPTCRFYPSCSAYSREAIQKYGPWKGVWLGLRRLCRCHPLHPGGYDPVI